MDNTDLAFVKQILKQFVDISPTPLELGFVSHPFANYSMQFINGGMVDILSDEGFESWNIYMKSVIDASDNIFRIFLMVNKPYLGVVFKYISDHLSNSDYAELLQYAWVSMENPNDDPNVSHREWIQMLKKADQKILMGEDYNVFSNFKDIVKVYRGTQSLSSTNGLSWSLSKDTAKWFATRFGKNGKIQSAEIPKKNIVAYFNVRDEKEVVLNPKYLMNIEEENI
jgi:hypothetical protein